MTRGGLCVKLKNFAEHHYNPDRLLYPMKRIGQGLGHSSNVSLGMPGSPGQAPVVRRS